MSRLALRRLAAMLDLLGRSLSQPGLPPPARGCDPSAAPPEQRVGDSVLAPRKLPVGRRTRDAGSCGQSRDRHRCSERHRRRDRAALRRTRKPRRPRRHPGRRGREGRPGNRRACALCIARRHGRSAMEPRGGSRGRTHGPRGRPGEQRRRPPSGKRLEHVCGRHATPVRGERARGPSSACGRCWIECAPRAVAPS